MAIFHSHTQIIGKSSGKSAVAAAAYRSASKLVEHSVDEVTGMSSEIIWDYSKKGGVIFSKVFTPGDTPSWAESREQLWNKVQKCEIKQERGQYSREFEIALPVELSCKQNQELLTEIVERCFVSKGMIADVNMHYDNTENPHSHIMLTMRELIRRDDGQIDFGLKNRNWNKASFINEARKQIAETTNKHLEMYGYDSRISHLSHKERGILLEPTIHIGVTGKHSPSSIRRERNDEIISSNAKQIAKYPELVLDKLSINKPVFTASDIEKELKKALLLGINTDNNGQNKSENSSQNTEDNNKNDSKNESQNSTNDNTSIPETIDETSDYFREKLLTAYSIVISSPKITLINPRDLKGRMLFGRTDQVELEDRLKGNIKTLSSGNNYSVYVIEEDITNSESGKLLSEQQKSAVKSILSGSNLSVLEGFPGAGKTTVMKEVSRLFVASGYKVMGTASTNKACQELAAKLGIGVENTTKLRQGWQKQKGYGYKYGDRTTEQLNLRYSYYKEDQYSDTQAVSVIAPNTVIIIDEASQLDSPTMDYFLSEAVKSNSKVILLGDNNQNPAIGSKGSFMKAGDIAGRVQLTEINRHQHSDSDIRDAHIQATQALGNYDIDEALSIYQSLGIMNILRDEQQKEQALVNDAVSKIIELAGADNKNNNKDTVALSSVAVGAYTNSEVNRLNEQIRSQLQSAGIVKGQGKTYNSGRGEELELCLGDQLIFSKNQPLKGEYGGVNNNDIGIVSKLGDGEFAVHLRCSASKKGYREVKISTRDEAAQFKYGYALTNYALQGATINHKFYSLDRYTGYEAFNVGATRHRIDCKFYASEETLENELYKTKDLDIDAVKAEYVANAYRYSGEDKVDVPLWKLGLSLLVSKRTDLNFARDYTYHDAYDASKEVTKLVRQLDRVRSTIEVERNKWLGSDEALKAWVQAQDFEIQDQDKSNTDQPNNHSFDAVIKIDLNTNAVNDQNKHSRFETELAKYFKFNAGEINIDAKAIMGSRKAFKAASSAEGHQIESSYQLDKQIKQQLSLLKQGVATNSGIEHLNWSDLSNLQQNLVLHSLLSTQEKKELTSIIRTSVKAEKVIDTQREVVADLSSKLNESATSDNDLLTGNLGTIRDYLSSRGEVIAAQQIVNDHNKELNRPAVKTELVNLIDAKLALSLQIGELKIKSIVSAEKNFAAEHFKKHSKEITELKLIKTEELTRDNKERLSELFNVRGARAVRINELRCNNSKEEGEPLSSEDINLMIAHLLDNSGSNSNILGIPYKELTAAVNNLSAAYEKRDKNANKIVKYYSGHVVSDDEQKTQKNQISSIDSKVDVVSSDITTASTPKPLSELSKSSDFRIDQGNDHQAKDNNLSDQVKISMILSQLGINYQTVKKHAGLISEKHYFEAKNQTDQLQTNKHYRAIMNDLSIVAWSKDLNQTKGEELLSNLRSSYKALELSIKDNKEELSELVTKVDEISQEKYALEDKLLSSNNYCQQLMPEYLSRVYNAAPEVVLENWQSLVAASGLGMALEQVNAKPEVLNPKLMGIGSLKGLGLGKSFSLTNDRSGAVANIEKLVPQFKSYEENLQIARDMEKELAQDKYNTELTELIVVGGKLEQLLPSTGEQKILELIGTHLLSELSNHDLTTADNSAEVSGDALSILNKIVDHDLIEDALLEHHSNSQISKQQQSKDENVDKDQQIEHNSLPSVGSQDIITDEVSSNTVVNQENGYRGVESQESVELSISPIHVIVKETKAGTSNESIDLFSEADQQHKEQASNNQAMTVDKEADLAAENNRRSGVAVYNKNKISNNSAGKSRYRTTAKTKNKEPGSYVRQRITYEQVYKVTTPSGYEEIFRNYAHMIVNKKIIRRGDTISAGSLSMDLSTKDGLWKRFSTEKGGNIFSLVTTATGCSRYEALQIVARKFGIYQGEIVYKTNDRDLFSTTLTQAPIVYESKPKDEWVARSKADQDQPLRPEQDLAGMLRNNKLEGLYEYKNTDNEIIGYTARFVDHETGKKNVLPIAYCYSEVQDLYKWKLKGFNDREFKPIYGAQKINNDLKPILIVEGEKAADHATELLPEYTVISWLGGSNGAAKADWSIVKNREVVIWPDNDEPGFRAAKTIAELIGVANNHSGLVTVIDPRVVQFDGKTHEHLFECGWDLADSLPNGITINNIKQVMSAARAASGDLTTVDGLISKVEQHYKGDEVSESIAKRIVWQDKIKGITTNFTDLDKEVKLERDCLAEFNSYTTLRADDYQGYRIDQGRLASKHEFLSVHRNLYKDILVQLGKREPKVPWANKFNSIQHQYTALAYTRKATRLLSLRSMVDSGKLADSEQLNKVINERTVIADDAKILHTLQMGLTLTTSHENKLEQVALEGRNIHSESYFEGDNIEDKVWQTVSDHKWLKDLACTHNNQALVKKEQIQDTLKAQNRAKLHKVNEFLKANRDIEASILKIDPDYNIEQLKDKLLGQTTSVQTKILEQNWLDTYKHKVSPELNAFSQQKNKAVTLIEMISILSAERNYCVEIANNHHHLVQILKKEENSTHINNIADTARSQPKALEYLNIDANNLIISKQWSEEMVVTKIKQAKNYGVVQYELAMACTRHYSTNVERDLGRLNNKLDVCINDQQFNNKRDYLAYCLNDSNMARYFKHSPNLSNLEKMYNKELEAQNHQKSKDNSFDRSGGFEL